MTFSYETKKKIKAIILKFSKTLGQIEVHNKAKSICFMSEAGDLSFVFY